MAQFVYLTLGSNLGNRLNYLQKAINQLAPKVTALRASSVYESDPWGFEDQGQFLNMALEATTNLKPDALLDYVKDIEKSLGRKVRFKNGPREIDIDILLFGEHIFENEGLRIPHPELAKRAFVLAPLAELIPETFLPETEKNINDLLGTVDLSSVHIRPDMEIHLEKNENRQ